MPEPRIEVTSEDIARVVARFYERVRAHPGLGPVFARHVSDWPGHEARIVAFWESAILGLPGYRGSPVTVHREARDVRPGMFAPWLALFDMTLREELPEEAARAWSALAHRIGRTLRAGVTERETLPGGVPKLI
ncbi:group III truncated hemoglobin [Limimaricola cinnabarinus]|jgi:hemoglobin|uniref:Globin family protein n=1 Tax=Limimaricola cinnabarinus TaxID=1125964 RepID=A0A2G1MFQ6_9RHOB|nr:group III truncated hemoglobin [Limimaricola cinnabarinus]PHP27571.1 globin family protein [Limimaricola cinnabarinus]